MEPNEDGFTADLIAKLAKASLDVRTVEGGNTPFVVAPNDYKLVPLDAMIQNDRSERPNRIRQSVEVWDAVSFIKYFTEFSDGSSRVFADVGTGVITGLLDYHEFAEALDKDDPLPRWCSHKLTLVLKKSPEWTLWTAWNKKSMGQEEFATFIEDNAPDVSEPNAATMKEIASDLHETQEMTFAGTTKSPNGSQKLNYSQENKSTFGKAEAAVPDNFTIAIPVYVGGGLVRLIARLRWRVSGGKAAFHYDLLRADAAERAAFDAVRGAIQDAIGTQILSGVVKA